jgi:hypothetical protein
MNVPILFIIINFFSRPCTLLPHQISEAANMYGQQMMCVNKVAIELHPHCFTRHIVEAFFPHILYK